MSLKWPLYRPRKHLEVSSRGCARITLGLTMGYNAGLVVSSSTRKYTDLSKQLNKLAKQLRPEMSYTSIHAGKNLDANIHCDSGNYDDSFTISFCRFSGGRLWIHSTSSTQSPYYADKPMRGMPSIAPGTTLYGRYLNTKHKLVTIPYMRLHAVEPFIGTRFSVTYYTVKKWNAAPTGVQNTLINLG